MSAPKVSVKVHMSMSVHVAGAHVPACGSYGWATTEDWDKVTCLNCRRRRASIDAKNRNLIDRFEALAKAKGRNV